jgi:hypothetical protein
MPSTHPFSLMESGDTKLQRGVPEEISPEEVYYLVMKNHKGIYSSGVLNKLLNHDASFAKMAIRLFSKTPVFGALFYFHPQQTQNNASVVCTALKTLHNHQQEIWELLTPECQSSVKRTYPNDFKDLVIGATATSTGQPGPYMTKLHEWLDMCASDSSDDASDCSDDASDCSDDASDCEAGERTNNCANDAGDEAPISSPCMHPERPKRNHEEPREHLFHAKRRRT